MGQLYIVKIMGHYHYFKTADARKNYLDNLSDWEQKAAETYEMNLRKAV